MSYDFAAREADVAYLLRIEFPTSRAPPPPGSGQVARLEHRREQSKIAARRTELLGLPPAALRKKVLQVQARERSADAERRERATPNAVKPTWKIWIRREEWSVCESVLLLLNIAPHIGLAERLQSLLLRIPPLSSEYLALKAMKQGESWEQWWIKDYGALSDSARRTYSAVDEIHTNARAAIRLGKLNVHDDDKLVPRNFLLWARGRNYEIPRPLHALIRDVPTIAQLQARIIELETQLANAWDQFDEESPTYPLWLDISFQAWRAASAENSDGRARRRLEAWIRENWANAKLTDQAINSIVSVANWDKGRGRKGKKPK